MAATAPSVARFLGATERRRSVRVVLRRGGVPIICQCGPQVLLSKANALGEFGAFIFTSKPAPIGSIFALELGFELKVHVPAQVRSIHPSNGMGVEFIALDEDSRNRLRRWMDAAQVQRRQRCR
jgi:PilZ domain